MPVYPFSHDPVDTVLHSLLRYVPRLLREHKKHQLKCKIPGKTQKHILEYILYVL